VRWKVGAYGHRIYMYTYRTLVEIYHDGTDRMKCGLMGWIHVEEPWGWRYLMAEDHHTLATRRGPSELLGCPMIDT
jgi:hypothetical protein